MKILVTGGAGFIGCNLIRSLLKQDFEVTNFDCLTYAGNLDSLRDVENHPRYQFVHGDITDAGAVDTVFANQDPDAVMHLAAETHVDRSIDAPNAFVRTNVIGTCQLLNTSLDHFRRLDEERQRRFRFLHVSTDEVYGSLGPDDPAFTESTPYAPRSPYAASKASSDHMVRAWYETFGLPVLITNCSNNYGPFQFPEKLIPHVTLRAINGQTIPVYGNGENVRDWLRVEDHVVALQQVLLRGTIGETYNIGGNNEQKNIDVVRLICRILDELRPLEDNSQIKKYEELIEFVEDRPGHDFRYAMNSSKLKDQLGLSFDGSFESALRNTVQWYLDNEPWWQRILNGQYRLERIGLGQEESA